MFAEPFTIEVMFQHSRVPWLVARLRERRRQPYDWVLDCPELMKPDPHVRHVVPANADI
jgi:hypothetical protein